MISQAPPPPAAFPAGSHGPVNVIVQVGPQNATFEQNPQTVGPPVKSKVLAGVLGILFGAFGVHRFYLGYVGIGLVQLLLTLLTCFYASVITGIWGLIEGILILVGTIDRDGKGRPLKQ